MSNTSIPGSKWWKFDFHAHTPESEDSSLELKAVLFSGADVRDPQPNSLADELAAFANTRDGVVVLGVDDHTRNVSGIPLDKLDAVDMYIQNICDELVKPPLHVAIFRIELPDMAGNMKPVIKIEVPRSLFVHHSPGGYFYRSGSAKRLMPPDYLARLFQQRSQARLIRFDDKPFLTQVWRIYHNLFGNDLRRVQQNQPRSCCRRENCLPGTIETACVHLSPAS